MMRKLFLAVIFLLFSISLSASEKEQVSIQLKWEHAFQFAGYYAAIEKGFYADEGLDVTLKEIDVSRDFVKDVIEGNSQYGVSDSALILYKLNKQPIVLISQILQYSPLVLISHRDSNIITPEDLSDKKITYSLQKSGGTPLNAMILKTIGNLESLDISSFTSYEDFINRKVDVTSAYSTSQPYWLKKQGVELNIIDPKSYGIDFYGDNFFTTEKEIREHPLRVQKMKRASLKGWEYALSHQEEIIDIIIQKYAPKLTKDILTYEAHATYQMIMPDLIPLGRVDKHKYERIAKTYKQLGMVEDDHVDDDFFYNKTQKHLQLSPKEKKWLENNPMIKLAVMDFWTTDKHENNIHTDLIKLLNKYGDLNIVPVKFLTWNDGFETANSGKHIHGITNLNWSKQREEKFLYTKAYNFVPNHLIVKKDNNKIKSLDDLKNKTIYLKKKIIAHNVVKDLSKSIKIIDLSSDDEIYKKLSKSKDVVATISYSVDKEELKKYNLKIVKSTYDKYGEISIGISHKYPELQSIINKIYKVISTNELTTLQNRVYKQNKNKTVTLSKKEKEWVKQHPIIKVGVGPDWAPLDFVNSNGEYTGIANDYLNLISQKTGLKFDLDVNIWNNNLQNIRDKKIDLLPAIYYTDERATYMDYTKPYFEMLDYFFIRDDLNVTTLKDLDGKRVAIPKGYAHGDILKKEFPHIDIVTVDTFSEAIDAVLENRADLLFDAYTSLSYVLKKSGISTIIPFKAYRGHNVVKLHMSVQKDNPKLASIINKGLSKITEKEKTIIYDRWLSIKKDDKQVNLTSEEKEWLEQNPTATFAGNRDRLPYIAINEQNNYIGIVADYLKEMETYIPLTFKPKSVKNQKELKGLLQNKSIDLIPGDRESTYLAKNYRHIDSNFEAPIVILMNDNHSFVNKLEDIKHLKIAYLQRRGYSKKLIQKYPSIPFIKATDAKEALQDLSLGKFDALLLTMPAAGYLIKTNSFHNIKIVGKTDVVFNLTLFVHKDKPLLYQIINKTRTIIPNIKDLEIIGKWQKVEFAKKTDYILLYQVIGFFLFFLAGSFYWNRKLRHEIDQRQNLESSLKESEAQMRTLIDNIPMQVIVTAIDGQILTANPKALHDYKATEQALLVLNINNFYADIEDRNMLIREIIEKGKVDGKIINFKQTDNSIRPMLLSVIPIIYKNQKALLSIALDMTERLKMEKDLEIAKEAAEYANHAKSEFLANMSHEIRTPMNSVIGFSELLSRQIKDPIQKDYLRAIMRGGHTLLDIINDILDLSKIEAGKLELHYESVDIKKLVLEMQSIFHVKLVQKNLNFEIDIDPSLPQYLLLDNIRVRQILFNLLGNAIKFTNQGTIRLSVRKSDEDPQSSKIDLQFCVEDSGIGIQESQLEHIFNSFEQQKGQDSQKYGGSGLGLAICKNLATIMNGTISVESKIDVGSKFTVILSNISISSVEAESKKTRKTFDNIQFERATVMVVDDIKDNRKLVISTLSEHGLEVIEAVDGKDAIEQLKNIKIDLILMDIKMPVMDGYEATKIIKNDIKLKNIPIVALTASVLGEDMQKIKEYQFDGYLRKPVTYELLLTEMERFLVDRTLDTTHLKNEHELNKNDIDKIPKVIDALENVYKKRWEEVKNSGDFSLIEAFVISLEKLAKDNDISLLSTYAKELKVSCESFDIERVDFMMNSYLSFIEKLKGLIK